MRLTRHEFETLVEQALAAVPARYRARMRNLAVVVAAEPPRPGLLGLYEGRPLTARDSFGGAALPDRITIYQREHERGARTLRALRELVAETVWHEIGHYFGLDERAVRRAERRRARRKPLL